MNRAGWRLSSLLVACGLSLQSLAIAGDALTGGTSDSSPLNELDAQWEMLRNRSWSMHDTSALYGRDDRDRTLSDDIRDSLLTTRITSERSQLRQRIEASKVTERAFATDPAVRQLTELQQGQLNQLTIIFGYWRAVQTVHIHEQLMQQLRNDWPSLRDALTDASIPLLRMEFRNASLSNNFNPAMDAASKLVRAYNEMRHRALRGLPIPGHPPSALEPRITACGPLQSPVATDGPASLIGETADIRSFYPAFMRSVWVEGSTLISLHINDQGCVIERGVERSSGVPDLDDAALRFAEQMMFHPAREQGKAIESRIRKLISFRMPDSNASR